MAGAEGSGSRSGKAASRRTTPVATGRVTPKGTVAPKQKGQSGRTTPPRGTSSDADSPRAKVAPPSSRYTPPTPKVHKVSPRWVPILMFALLGLGVLLIIVNYLGVLPGGSDNTYLLIGLAAITGGFVTATQYR